MAKRHFVVKTTRKINKSLYWKNEEDEREEGDNNKLETTSVIWDIERSLLRPVKCSI